MAATVHAQNASHKIEQEASHFKSNTKVCIDRRAPPRRARPTRRLREPRSPRARLIEKANDLVDSRADLGDERTLAMLDKCEAVLRDLISSEAAANARACAPDGPRPPQSLR